MSKFPVTLARLAGVSLVALALVATPARADVSSTATVTVNVEVYARTVLRVSAEQLRFDVPADQGAATAALQFSAAARTRSDAEVLLTVEPERWIEGPGGAADAEALVTFTGEGDGTLGGELAPNAPSIAGRWIGSGKREGRLLFTLHASASGTYQVPVRLVLTAP